MDASGAWVSSTVDLLRLVGGIDGRANRPDILSAALIGEMTSKGAPVCANGACYYGAGWFVRPTQGDANWWHGGDLPGTTTLLVRTSHNFSWAALFNANPTHNPMNSLPLFVYASVSTGSPEMEQRAYAGATVLLAVVLSLYLLARLAARGRKNR